ncbi:MAG: hypothetical protein EOO16_14980 [Chitinophagaceae bacterium]|nr:MAG: hypothetical protein EOO16_14980 [Chitinophagaceae bacterium]
MNPFYCCMVLSLLAACGNTASVPDKAGDPGGTVRRYRGAISNGMKGDSLFFEVSADGRKLQNLTFKGYWRCSGKLEQTRVGPDGSFSIANGKVKGALTEPPSGGSTAWRFEIDASIQKSAAAGTFRMNINNLGCDTYVLRWTASAY